MNIEDITSKLKPRKATPYNQWKQAVLAEYPKVFFPAISTKKKRILDAVESAIKVQGVDVEQFLKWLVVGWSKHSHRIVVKGPIPVYPELDFFLIYYAQLLNLYMSEPKFVNIAPRKNINLSKFLNDD